MINYCENSGSDGYTYNDVINRMFKLLNGNITTYEYKNNARNIKIRGN